MNCDYPIIGDRKSGFVMQLLYYCWIFDTNHAAIQVSWENYDGNVNNCLMIIGAQAFLDI